MTRNRAQEATINTAPVRFDYRSADVEGPAFWAAVEELRRHGPLVWVDDDPGYWAATSYEVVRRIAQDWENFTSTQGVAHRRPSFEAMPRLMPIESDPPSQRVYRRKLNPKLTPKALSGLEEPIRAIADELIDEFVDAGRCDLAVDFARKFPGTVFFRLLAHCSDDDFRAAEEWSRIVSFESDNPERFTDAARRFRGWVSDVLGERAGQAQIDDVVNAVLHLNDEVETFADYEVHSGLQLLAQGGIGTSASAIGAMIVALCEDPELQQRVRDDRSLIRPLMEESLRIESPLPILFRTAQADVEIAGQQIRQGDKVCLLFGAAGRDPEVFENADRVDVDCPHRPHLSFGVGVHRCIGSNLARLQVPIAVDQLLTRLGPFRMPEGSLVRYSNAQARGPSSIPLEFTPPAPATSESSPDVR